MDPQNTLPGQEGPQPSLGMPNIPRAEGSCLLHDVRLLGRFLAAACSACDWEHGFWITDSLSRESMEQNGDWSFLAPCKLWVTWE
jgi:hypothetical protein